MSLAEQCQLFSPLNVEGLWSSGAMDKNSDGATSGNISLFKNVPRREKSLQVSSKAF